MGMTVMAWVLGGAVSLAAVEPLDPAPTGPVSPVQEGLGQPAPKITDVEWMQGRKFRNYKRGTVYVVDFWSSWSGFCRDAMAGYQSLREKHADDKVAFISVAIWPRSRQVPPDVFVERRQDLMPHTIVRDKTGETVKAWKQVADLSSIPRAAIIDKKGRLAWFGQPHANLEDALEAVLAEDDERLVASNAAFADMLEQTTEVRAEYSRKLKYGGHSKVISSVDKLLEADPRYYAYTARFKYSALIQSKRTQEAAAFGRALVDDVLAEREYQLNLLAWTIAQSDDIEDDARDLELALAAATRADELSGGKDWSILDTLARVHFKRDELEAAISAQERAIEQTFSHLQRTQAQTILTAYVEKRKPPENTERPVDG